MRLDSMRSFLWPSRVNVHLRQLGRLPVVHKQPHLVLLEEQRLPFQKKRRK